MQQILFLEPSKILKTGYNLLKQRKGIINVKKDVNYLLIVTDDGEKILKLGLT